MIENQKRMTLKEFIDENDKLLAAMGVMGALAALFTPVKNGQYIAFLAFAMLLVLDVELVHTFYKSRGRGWGETLILFETLLEFFIVGVGVFIAITYPSYMEHLFGLIAGLMVAWLILVVGRPRIKKRL